MNCNSTNNRNMFVWKHQPVMFYEYQQSDNTFVVLKHFLKTDNVNLILVGPSSSGKTSLLNSIVHEYFEGVERSKWDTNVLFINSLKDQGVTFYRTDIKVFCQTQCSVQNKKKIVVIDDIDYVSDHSQQLLKISIDKYKHNVHFIFSCSSLQKVVKSIQSRMHSIQLQPLEEANIKNIIKNICIYENMNLDEKSMLYLHDISNKKVKRIIHYLEKLSLLGKTPLNIANVQDICHDINFTTMEEYNKAISENSMDGAISILRNLNQLGYSVLDILDSYFTFVKHTNTILDKDKYNLIPIICKYITIFSSVHENEIELVFFTNSIKDALHSCK